MKLLLAIFCLIAVASSHPLPQRLTEEEFRSLNDDLSSSDNKVDIFSGYAKIRRQGRNHNGRSISFNKPLTVRNPFEFATAGQNLPQQSREKIKKFPEMAPVFNLKAMLEAEAEKLKQKVEEASLMAAKAAEEAEEKVKSIAQQALNESEDMAEEEVEEIIEKVIDSAIEEAKEIFENEEDESTEENSTEEIVTEDEEALLDFSENEVPDNDNIAEVTTETSDQEEPSSDIDLGSVQEV